MNKERNATVDAYIAAWNRMDFAALQTLWNVDEEQIYYVAEEVENAFHDFADVVEYWELTAATVEWVKMSITDLNFKTLTGNLAVATYEMHVDACMHGDEKHRAKPFGTDVRVSAILRNTAEGWRYIHYAEAPLGALPFVRRAYHANLRD